MAKVKTFTGMAGGMFHTNVPVKKFAGGRMIGGAAVILEMLPNLLAQAVVAQANEVLEGAKAKIESNVGGPGIALGAGSREKDIAISGYVSTGNAGPYERAKQAFVNSGSRDAKRGLFADPAFVTQPEKGHRAVVSFAAGRAKLMHDGYTRKGGQRMRGTPFLEEAFDEALPKMQVHLKVLGGALQQISIPSFVDVDEAEARNMNDRMEASYRYQIGGRVGNLLGQGRKVDRQMKRRASRSMDRAAGLADLRDSISRASRG